MELPKLSADVAAKLSGVLPVLAVAAVLQKKLSGLLKIQSDKIIRQVQFNKGDCISGFSNAKSELPGTFLHREKKLSDAQYETYLQETRAPKANHWEIVARLAAFSPADAASWKQNWTGQLAAGLALLGPSEIQFQPAGAVEKSAAVLTSVRFAIATTGTVDSKAILTLCPLLVNESHVQVPPEVEKNMASYPLDPEEKGLLTVVLSNATIQEIFTGSFLKPDKIYQLLFAYWLSGLLRIESAEQAAHNAYEASLSATDRAFRDEMKRLEALLKTGSYYEWLGVPKDCTTEAVEQKAVTLIGRYTSPEVEKLFLEKEKELPSNIVAKLAEARLMLIDAAKRKEYDAYLQTGKTGSFVSQSVSVKKDEIFAKVQKLTAEGQGVEAVALLERSVSEIPDSVDLVVAYARIALEQGGAKDSARRDKVLSELKRALKIPPPSAGLLEVFGAWCEGLGQNEKAKEAYAKALEVSPFSNIARAALDRIAPEEASRAAVSAIFKKLGKLDYYQLLGIERKVNMAAVQAAYRECTRRFHPDRFFQSTDARLRDESKEVYKRMVEAYMTLKNATKRNAYDSGL